jgi:hypothetical protein
MRGALPGVQGPMRDAAVSATSRQLVLIASSYAR